MADDDLVIDTTPQERASARYGDYQRRQRQQQRRQIVSAPSRGARAITQRSGEYSGKGMLTAELLIGFVIILIRIVADFDPETGKGNVLHPEGQYGPLPIAVGLILTFFALSLLAMGGGTRAKYAVVFGGTVILALAMNSISELQTISGTLGNIGQVTVPAPSGDEVSGASGQNVSLSALGLLGEQSGGLSTGTISAATPSSTAPPAASGIGTNPDIYTQQAGARGGPKANTGTGRTVPSSGPGSFRDPLS